MYNSATCTFLEPHHLHKASNHPVISKLIHHFYLQHPSSHKHFNPWDVVHLLSLLEGWTPASFLTTFKLAWKTATLLVLVTVKHCSDLTLCIDNQHLFLQHYTAIFIPLSGGKTDHLGHLSPQIRIEFHTNVNLCPIFYLEAYLRHTEPFRMKPDGSHVTSLFWVTIGSTDWSVLKPFLGQGKFFVLLKHMSPGSLYGAAALTVCVSLVCILHAGDWARVSTLSRHYFPLTLLLWIGTRTLYSMPCWVSVSRSSLGKCQTLTYIQSCICWAVRP